MRLQDRPAKPAEGPAGASELPPDTAAQTTEEKPHGLYRVGFAYGRFIYKVRWLVILLWVAGVAVSVPFAASLGSLLTGGGYDFKSSDSMAVGNILQNTLHQPPSSVLVAFQSVDTPVSDPAYQEEVRSFVSRAQAFQHVTSVQPVETTAADGSTVYLPGKDGKTTFVTVNFNTNADATEHLLPQFRTLLPSGAAADPAKVYLTGGPAVYSTFTDITQKDTTTAETRALPIALIVLLAVFGTVVAALLPLVLAVVAVPVALALIYPIALHSSMSVFVENIASIVGLGISIDYSLFMTRRFREELARGRAVRDAIGWTVATAGEAILFSGMTVMIGFIGLLLIGLQFMTSFGIGGAVVVAAAVTAALTLLPALLSVLGTKVNALRLPLLGRLTMPRATSEDEGHGFWHGLALGVMKRPVLVVVAVTAILVALAWPIFSINIGTPSSSSLPPDAEARQGLDILNAQFPQTNENPIVVVAQSPDGSSMLTQANLDKVDALSSWLATVSHVTSVTSLTSLPQGQQGGPALSAPQLEQLYTSGQYQGVPALAQLVHVTTNDGTTVLTVKTDAPVDSAEGKQLIDDLRAGQAAHAGGMKVLVGGFQATSLDFNRYLYGNFPRAILFILIATYILLLIMFRSVVLPLKAVLMNVLSVSAAYGVLVFVFQQGHFSNLLGFTADGFIDSTIPILLFCLLFGLSMDYEVFLLSRIHEEWLRTHNNRMAVARGLEKTGGVITNAALLFVIVTGAFTFTRVIITKETGLGMTVAVLVDATIIRSLLVPATMRLIGRWNWWFPGRALPPKPVETQA